MYPIQKNHLPYQKQPRPYSYLFRHHLSLSPQFLTYFLNFQMIIATSTVTWKTTSNELELNMKRTLPTQACGPEDGRHPLQISRKKSPQSTMACLKCLPKTTLPTRNHLRTLLHQLTSVRRTQQLFPKALSSPIQPLQPQTFSTTASTCPRPIQLWHPV